MTVPKWVIEVFAGGLAGLAVAIGGAIKDSPYEGFDAWKFVRSPIIGAVEGPVVGYVFKHPNPALVFLSTIGTERATVETYKLVRARAGTYAPMKFQYGEWGVKAGGT